MTVALVVPSDGGEFLNVVGERIRILADSARTDGKCVIFENISEPGNGPPLHRHARDDELFFVIEGRVKFVIDGRESTAAPGGFVYAPRGSVHTFVNVGDSPSRMLITCCPGGLEQPFREVDRLFRQNNSTPDEIMAAFRRFDLEFLGPPLSI